MENTDTNPYEQIQFKTWYPTLQSLKLTYKSKVIELSDLFVRKYLQADGMSMPEFIKLEDDPECSPEEVEAYKNEVKELRQKIQEALNEYTKGVLVKLNWTSTKDAEFLTETLSAYTPDEVFLQLKGSSLPDLKICLEKKIPVTLCLRKWHSGHQKAMEFRAYILQDRLRGIQQKDECAFYPQIDALKDVIFEKITGLVTKITESDLELKDYILDIYIDKPPRHRPWVQDIVPCTQENVALKKLFTYEEIQSLEQIDFKILSNDSVMRAQESHNHRFPMELNNMDQLQDIIQMMKEQQVEEEQEGQQDAETQD